MDSIVLELPAKLLDKLKEMAELEGKTLDELVIDAILARYSAEDPEIRIEIHLGLCGKYMGEARGLLNRGDYVQASEKLWGAASQMLKAVAAKRGVELRSHGELHRFIAKLVEELGDPEIRRLWGMAGLLHQNFYEGWLPGEIVEGGAEDVEKLVERLRKLLPP